MTLTKLIEKLVSDISWLIQGYQTEQKIAEHIKKQLNTYKKKIKYFKSKKMLTI